MTTTTRTSRSGVAEQVVAAPDRRRWLVLGGGAAVIVAAVVVWIVAFTSILGVKTITIRGEHVISAGQIRQAAAISSGTPLIRLDTAAVVRRIEALPAVASASVRTSYPSTVEITVVERAALGYVQTGTDFTLVDKTGAQFRTVSVRPLGLPLFAVPTGPQETATGRAVASVASSLTPALRSRIASIQAFDPTAITLLLTDHRVVRWGSAERNADKARILPTMLTQPGTQLDVTDPDQVFTH